MNRILTFHEKGIVGDGTRIGAAFYTDTAFEPIAVRIDAEIAPVEGDMEIDIFDDGVSIFENHAHSYSRASTSKGATIISGSEDTTVSLGEGQTREDAAATSFVGTIEEDSWITCKIMALNGAKNVTVQLELQPLEE